MGFIMDGVAGNTYDRKYKDKDLLKRIVKLFLSVEKKRILITLIIALVADAVIGMGIPIIISMGIDDVIDNPSQKMVLGLFLLISLLGIASWGLGVFHKYIIKRTIAKTIRSTQNISFDSMINMDMSFFDYNSTAKIISRITGDTEALGNITNLAIGFSRNIIIFFMLFGVLLYINPQMTMILGVFIPVLVGISLGFRKIARTVSSHLYRAISEVNSNVKETISGIVITKNFKKEKFMKAKFSKINEWTYKTNLKQGLVFSAILPILSVLSSIGASIIIYFGAMSVLNLKLNYGELYLFVQAVSLIWNPITSLSSFWSQFQEGLAAAERIFSLIDAKSKVQQIGRKKLQNIRGAISIREVSLIYKDAKKVLEKLSLDIRPKEKIALVGQTGSGKTTITRLLLRFYEFQEGQVLVDNNDIRSLDLSSYMNNIGYVSQVPYLFSGSVIQNILYGNPDATINEAEKAAYSINNGLWINDLSNGLKTDVGERGGKLSMGQRQLVALTRIIVKNPAILILDEATASIDPITEFYIKKALDTIMHDKTVIIIAHRLSTVKSVDRIIVLSEGKVVEDGSHEDLLMNGHHYKNLYQKYYLYQSDEYIMSKNNI